MERVLSSQVTDRIGQVVKICGWAETIRKHAKVVFIDVRDRAGLVQVVCTDNLLEVASQISPESVVTIIGKVTERPQSLVNINIISGSVEIQADSIRVESSAKALPIPLNDRTVSEEWRLKYRYLDLRSKKMAENIRIRHQMNQYLRQELTKFDFAEIETPYISKSTPEGARDFLVPSRIMPGHFYALPQSPQQYKQLLMVAGFERYFQIARCFRDEDSRGDRQPEFSQLDIELSFTSQEEILQITEDLFLGLVKKFFPEKTLTFSQIPRLKYQEVMEKYGTDKPDLRQDKTNDDELAFAFIVDFPLFEWKESEKRFDSTHHPFTAPKPKWEANFEKHPDKALALQHDLILNGHEVAGGSIRIHQSDLLERVFKFLGHSHQKIEADFGHLLEAFQYGVPPHGGIACGLDRIYMILLKERSIRDLIAFPKAGDGRDLLMNAPAPVEETQLKELGLKTINK